MARIAREGKAALGRFNKKPRPKRGTSSAKAAELLSAPDLNREREIRFLIINHAGISPHKIQRVIAETGVYVTRGYIRKLMEKVNAQLDVEMATHLKQARRNQIQRLMDTLSIAREAKDLTAMLACERQLATVCGTNAPQQVEHMHHVDVQQTVISLIAGLGPEEMASMLNEYQEKAAFAEQYEKEHPQLPTAASSDRAAE